MKKIIILLAIVTVALISTSCAPQYCSAYSDTGAHNIEMHKKRK